jgi:hypothetical protein
MDKFRKLAAVIVLNMFDYVKYKNLQEKYKLDLSEIAEGTGILRASVFIEGIIYL